MGLNEYDSLDAILSTTNISRTFDLLSIDIDGNDYHVWNDLRNYQPKVVVIEINPSIPNNIHFVQERNQTVKQGSSLLAFQGLGMEKGYELVECTLINAFFVKRELYPLFDIEDNTLESIYTDRQCQTQIFQLLMAPSRLVAVRNCSGMKLRSRRRIFNCCQRSNAISLMLDNRAFISADSNVLL